MRRLRLIREERGIALVMALGIMTVLGITLATVIDYSASNARTSSFSKRKQSSFDLAEAGINNALAVLNKPTNNALDPDLLPSTTNSYEGGTVTWSGVLDRTTAVWTLTSVGSFKNPTGPKSGNVTRTLTAKVPVTPTLTQPLNNPAWNYMYSTKTGDPSGCDETLNNNVSGSSRMYVEGNFCLGNNVGYTASSLLVKGNLTLNNNAYVGDSSSMSTRVETYVGGFCKYGNNSSHTPCAGDTDHVYSKKNGPSWVVGVNSTVPVVAAPAADWATWYENAMPGPSQSCTTSSGTVPTFDTNYPTRDNSVATAFDLTPSSSYTCRVGPGASTTLTSALNATQTTVSVASAAGFPTTSFRIRIDDEYMTVTAGFGTTTWTVTRGVNGSTATSHVTSQTVSWDTPASGELSWNATTKTLTVAGTIFIDGSAKVANGALNAYNGQATLYLGGTFYVDGQLCGGISGSSCDFSAWNPNNEMLTIVANGSGSGSPVPTTDSISIANNGSFQGGLFATKNLEFGNNAKSDGPMVGTQIVISNNVQTDAFPTITTVPAGMPGNPAVYAQPNPPQSFTG